MKNNSRPSWRTATFDLIRVGKSLASIDRSMRNINAILVYNDKLAIEELKEAIRESRRLSRALEGLLFSVTPP